MDVRIPTLGIEIVLESNPLKSTMLVGRLGVPPLSGDHHGLDLCDHSAADDLRRRQRVRRVHDGSGADMDPAEGPNGPAYDLRQRRRHDEECNK